MLLEVTDNEPIIGVVCLLKWEGIGALGTHPTIHRIVTSLTGGTSEDKWRQWTRLFRDEALLPCVKFSIFPGSVCI